MFDGDYVKYSFRGPTITNCFGVPVARWAQCGFYTAYRVENLLHHKYSLKAQSEVGAGSEKDNSRRAEGWSKWWIITTATSLDGSTAVYQTELPASQEIWTRRVKSWDLQNNYYNQLKSRFAVISGSFFTSCLPTPHSHNNLLSVRKIPTKPEYIGGISHNRDKIGSCQPLRKSYIWI